MKGTSLIPPCDWPEGVQCMVTLTFDFDAETLWIARDAKNSERPGVLSQGTYAGKVGIPRILDLLDEYRLPGTFFVPGWTADKYQDRVEAILAAGHEIGHHGYMHEWIDPKFPREEREVLEKGLASLARHGVRPTGYRSPAGETSAGTLALLSEYGFEYDSSFMDDVTPYWSRLSNGSRGPLEIPFHWHNTDMVYGLFSVASPRPIMSNEHIFNMWTAEFEEVYRWGAMMNVVAHPEIIGRPARLALLRRFIEHVQRYPGIRFVTCGDLAKSWKACNPGRVAEQYQIG